MYSFPALATKPNPDYFASGTWTATSAATTDSDSSSLDSSSDSPASRSTDPALTPSPPAPTSAALCTAPASRYPVVQPPWRSSSHPMIQSPSNGYDCKLDKFARVKKVTREEKLPKIPRPQNSFIIFRNHLLQSQAAQGRSVKGIEQVSFSTFASHQWKALSKEDRHRFEALALEEKKAHMRKYPDYKYCPKPKAASRNLQKRTQANQPPTAVQTRFSSPISLESCTFYTAASQPPSSSSISTGPSWRPATAIGRSFASSNPGSNHPGASSPVCTRPIGFSPSRSSSLRADILAEQQITGVETHSQYWSSFNHTTGQSNIETWSSLIPTATAELEAATTPFHTPSLQPLGLASSSTSVDPAPSTPVLQVTPSQIDQTVTSTSPPVGTTTTHLSLPTLSSEELKGIEEEEFALWNQAIMEFEASLNGRSPSTVLFPELSLETGYEQPYTMGNTLLFPDNPSSFATIDSTVSSALFASPSLGA